MIADTFVQNYVSFPGLGIGRFKLDPVAFRIGNTGIEIRWYGIIICIGMILAFWYASTRAKTEKVKFDDILDMTLFSLIFGIIGARLYYVIFRFDEFREPGNIGRTLYNIVAIWNGGLAIYGAVIAGLITILIFAKIKRMRPSVLLDIAAPSVMLGQIVGRWGNFTNSEAHGGETTSFLRMGLSKSYDGVTFSSETFYHPTFLYESLWNLVGFILIAVFYKKKKYHGQVFLFYMTWYGLGRMLIEGLRTDSLYVGPLRVSQVLAGIIFVAGLALLILGQVRLKKGSAEPVGAYMSGDAEDVDDDEDENGEESEDDERDGESGDGEDY